MKKLLFILLGLTSLNVDANGCGGEYQPATGTCRIIDSSGGRFYTTLADPNLPIMALLRVNRRS